MTKMMMQPLSKAAADNQGEFGWFLGGLWAEVGLSHAWLFMRNFYAHTQRLFGSSSWHPGILVGEW